MVMQMRPGRAVVVEAAMSPVGGLP
jgi:hypothetical protein